MKKLVIFGIVSILLLPLLMLGCKTEAKTIELTIDDFMAENNIVKNIELIRPGSLIVRLGSNPTTGYEWEEAEISTPAVVAQASREFVGPEDTGMVGAGGTDVWVFDSKEAGTTTIKMSYGRPWEGGEKDTFTLTINVTVK
jgi:inhibitor of cysteine peptidase